MEKCSLLPSEREQLERLANDTDDPLLANAIHLILRGSFLPAPVVQCMLNGCAALLDAHDAAKRVLSKKRLE